MSILDTIRKDYINALKSGEKVKVDILRMVTTSLTNAQIQKGRENKLTEAEEIKVLSSEAKKLKDAIEKFKAGKRDDLAEREKEQLDILLEYLPEQLSAEELEKTVKEVIDELGAKSRADMGNVMGAAMKNVEGKADGNQVKEIVMKLLPQ